MAANKPQSAPPKLLLNQRFYDLDAMGETVGFDLNFRQLEAGQLNAQILLLAGPRNLAIRVEFDRKFHQRGCPPPGILTFGLPDQESGPLRWNGREAKPGALINFNNGRLDGVNSGNFGGYTLSFTEDLLHQTALILSIDLNVPSIIHSIAFWDPQDAEHNLLRRNLRFLEHAAVTKSEYELRKSAEIFNFDLAASVVRILGRGQGQPPRESAPFRAAVLKRALLLIDDPGQTPLSVAEMCQTVGASWATLERAFSEEFGMAPKAYIQTARLGTVRQQLLESNSTTLITDVANRCGFWHMGRFAANYRKQFGELPSATLDFNRR